MRKLDFYFDFMSPFAYLAFQKLPEIVQDHGISIVLHPVDLPRLKVLAGNTGPANVSIPIKIAYLREDLDRWALRYGVPLAFPASLKSAQANAAAVRVIETVSAEQSQRFVKLVWDEIWGRGGDPEDPGIIERASAEIGADPAPLLNFARSGDAATRLVSLTKQASEAGVFGAPTMVLGDKMWWGNDRLDFLAEALKSGV
jgi:2-hydroxychromene-2-carboxylate isomerase